ncbi:MAG: helix-turn-helix transcriptional regulator [Dermatophilaceae bacterium]
MHADQPPRTPAGPAAYAPDDDTPVFVISVAAQLAGMHAQTLRQYDRLGLVSPSRTRGGGRRYSAREVAQLREVQRLSQVEGVSLAGIQRILDLENHVGALQARVGELLEQLESVHAAVAQRVFAAGVEGDIVAMRPGQRPARPFGGPGRSLVVWQPVPR